MPPDTHVDLMPAATRAGKAALCEKPVDLDIKRIDAAVAELEALERAQCFQRRILRDEHSVGIAGRRVAASGRESRMAWCDPATDSSADDYWRGVSRECR
jgi:hypothetical protein